MPVESTLLKTQKHSVKVEYKTVDYQDTFPAGWQLTNEEGWIPWHVERREETLCCLQRHEEHTANYYKVHFYRVKEEFNQFQEAVIAALEFLIREYTLPPFRQRELTGKLEALMGELA